jgi:omega-6 fatty acid desaturase (delta-12 desaturase)
MEAATLGREAVENRRPANTKAWWVEPLAPYTKPDLRRSLWCLANSVVPYFALSVAMYFLLDVSYVLVLLVALPAAGSLLRTYIIFHDCSHGSFLATKRANTWLGVVTGLIVYSPFHSWRHEHAGHHATSGDLDRRGVGDVDTWTVAEYKSKPWPSRLGYRLVRSGWVMFTIGPIWALALQPRMVPLRGRKRMKRSHVYTNLALAALVGGVIWAIGWQAYLLVQLPTMLIAGSAGVWLFYVQHQFEDVYWTRNGEWSYLDAALRGSSHLKLPKVLQFFTGNIGLHHIHHLQPRIPNYNLQRAHDENEFLHAAPVLTLWCGLKTVRLKLYDEASGRLVTFRQANASPAAQLAGAG